MKFEMKKRILALALAGTTAFSVFGAAMSANAGSTHVIYGNDAYTTYKLAEVITDGEWEEIPGAHEVIGKTTWAKKNPAAISDEKYDELDTLKEVLENADYDAAMKALGYTPIDFIYVTSTEDGVGVSGINSVGAVEVNTYFAEYKYYMDKAGHVYYAEKNPSAQDVDYMNGVTKNAGDQLTSAYNEAVNYIEDNSQYQELYAAEAGLDKEVWVGSMINYGNGTVSDAELSRDGETIDPDTVYAYDYFDKYAGVADFVEAFNEANWVRDNADSRIFYNTPGHGAELDQIIYEVSEDDYTLSTGFIDDYFYTYNSARANTLDEYVEFLGELGLIDYTTTNKIKATTMTEKDFLAAFDYLYGGKDVYNFKGLVRDIFETIDDIVYGYNRENWDVDYASSNLVYLMQQYDKYTDGSYIGDHVETVKASRWAELLIASLEAVDTSDFTTAVAYNSWKRQADKAIAAYENAANTAAQATAIQALYDAVTASYGRSAGADKTELVDSMNALYFNNKVIPEIYLDAVVGTTGNSIVNIADLVLYGYDQANAVIDASVVVTGTEVKAVYPIYPVADYVIRNNSADTYIGNDGKIGAASVTDEYEWFWNVYQLAATVNGMTKTGTYQGIIDTVNDALVEAVADLAPSVTPAGSTALRLEEAVEDYAGKIDTDYIAKYYDAYTKANEIAAEAEGNMATKYAIEMVITSGVTLAYQSSQSTITKGEIADLKSAIKDANAAIKALKDNKEKYNASQLLALNAAVANAEKLVAVYEGTSTSTVNMKNSTGKTGDKDQILKSDVENAIKAINNAIEFKEFFEGWSKTAEGKWQYGKDGAYFQNGWLKDGSTWYYFKNGVALSSEWLQEDGNWYYLNSNCGAAIGWCKVDGNWYYFGGNNAMKTGWQKVDGNWYYLSPESGRMLTGWVEVGGKWYYMSKESNALGQMLCNTTVEGYALGADGAMIEK